MSKYREKGPPMPREPQQVPADAAPKPADAPVVGPDPPPSPRTDSSLRTEANTPPWKRCPSCWGGLHGRGFVFHTRGQTRYCKCDRCGFSYVVKILPTEVVSIQVPEVEER